MKLLSHTSPALPAASKAQQSEPAAVLAGCQDVTAGCAGDPLQEEEEKVEFKIHRSWRRKYLVCEPTAKLPALAAQVTGDAAPQVEGVPRWFQLR